MKQSRLLLLALWCVGVSHAAVAHADEGMWLPRQLPERADDLKRLGLELDPAALADLGRGPLQAIVNFGGCSASFVSSDGLIVTNHHCAEDALQYISTPERNAQEEGFYAASREGELWAGPGSRLLITVESRDVTREMKDAMRRARNDRARFQALDRREKELVAACEKTPGFRCELVSEMGGNQYRLIKSQELVDVRIVAAPPEMVGFYGGDIDNWMWPRHCGDFSFFRAYVAADGSSSAFDATHVPYRPPSHLTVSAQGVDDGDFVMVAGYPGETNRLRTAREFDHAGRVEYPWQIETMKSLIDILDEVSATGEEAAIRLRPMRFGLANYEKNNEGMLDGFESSHVVDRIREREEHLRAWIAEQGRRSPVKPADLDALDAELARREQSYIRNALVGWMMWSNTLLGSAHRAYWLSVEKTKPDLDRDQGYQERDWQRIRERFARRDSELVLDADKRLLTYFVQRADALPANARVQAIDALLAPHRGAADPAAAAVDALYAGTALGTLDKRLALLDASQRELDRSTDPMVRLAIALQPLLREIDGEDKRQAGADALLRPPYVAGLQALDPNATYPDANSTLRITYGQVRGYDGPDGTWYKPFTTLAGIVAKHTGEFPFAAPQALLDAIASDKGDRFAAPELNAVPVNFLSTLDTTGGNSGSATLNARGELVGLLFDGNYESMASDWLYDTGNTRSLHVEVRYMLWYLERVMQAGPLLRELGIAAP